MKKLSKSQRQTLILTIALLGIVCALGYAFRGFILPRPSGTLSLPHQSSPLVLPEKYEDPLPGRGDFTSLKRFGDVPVKPAETPPSSEPFFIAPERIRR